MAKRLKNNKKGEVIKGEVIPKEVSFDYIKSNFFRVIQMDGAFGGLNLSGDGIHMAIYNERRPLPKTTVQEVKPDGSLGQENRDKRVGRQAFVREIEADVVLNLRTAIILQTWLSEKIALCAKSQGMTAEQLQEEMGKAREARSAQKPKGRKRV